MKKFNRVKKGRRLESNKKIIQGKCPYCNTEGSVSFTDMYHGNNKYPDAVDIPYCEKCHCDEIEIRKINNRRYKIVGK